MTRILIAAVAALSFAGIASAQQAPSQSGSTRIGAQSQSQSSDASSGIDYTQTSSVSNGTSGGYSANVTKDDMHR